MSKLKVGDKIKYRIPHCSEASGVVIGITKDNVPIIQWDPTSNNVKPSKYTPINIRTEYLDFIRTVLQCAYDTFSLSTEESKAISEIQESIEKVLDHRKVREHERQEKE